MVTPIVTGALGTVLKEKGTGTVENWWTSRDHENYSIAEIGQNTEKSSRYSGRLAIFLDSSERPSANAYVKNPQGEK